MNSRPSSSRRLRSRGTSSVGFTLIEMLIALVMAGAVMGPLYVITRGIAEQTGSKQLEIEAMQRARIAMNTLIRDFSRAGLFTSPNTAVDGRFFNGDAEMAGSTAHFRPAVAHLNPDDTGADAVLLAGNFLGSSIYRAYATDLLELTFIDTVQNREECERQFNPLYAYAHITDDSGRDLDAKVAATPVYTPSTRGCQLTIEPNDHSAQSFKLGDTLTVSANQTVVYRVESGTLVRYFAAYESPVSPNAGDCDPAAADSTVTLIEATRQVIANFVQDFQVWFRPVTESDGWTEPHYQTLEDVIAENEGNFADGLTPPSNQEVVPLNAEEAAAKGSMTCAALNTSGTDLIGPERARSALIRLTVRSEKSELSLRRLPDDDATRLEKHLLAADNSTPTADGDDPYAYVLRTVTTEVDMPNLAARSDML